MTATFNHTIIAANDPTASAAFYQRLLEANDAPVWGPFVNLQLDDGVLLQFADPAVEFTPVHIAFLLDDDHFDRAYAQIQADDIEHWADPQRRKPGQTNTEHNGRGLSEIRCFGPHG
ncbi:VOC family protein [Branchiibius sp. NY16-3462-2]|uniref:VOC family protein n=1 Tax=Branchiibius sp. NY16-3462-2 TaxID=1807500 RepID=UPI0007925CD2|nr:VOC family protein [Branchiibius sp. NY16-3462-2]KYH45434.1 glyoxalase [Branchiibius sp. NY16-3462-2]